MMRTRLLFGSLALVALAGPGPALAKDFSRGNITAVDWNVMQIAIKTPQGGILTYKIDPNASVKFTDCPECFPNPKLRDLTPPMYIHFAFEDQDVDLITDVDVKEIGSAPRRVRPGQSGGGQASDGRGDRGDRGGGGSQELKVKILRIDERRGTFQADVAGRRQDFRADNRGDLRDFREGDLAIITVERRGGEEVATRMRATGRNGRVTMIDDRRGEIAIEVNGREHVYRVENKRMLDRVKEGDRVTFDTEERNGREVLTSLDR
jgi:Cu/Ag efflux protein CusF